MLDVAHLVMSGGVLGTDQLPVLVGLDRQEPLILPGLKKRSALRDSNLLPISNSLQQSPCRRRIRWFLYIVGLLITLGYCSDVVRWHNGERLWWQNGERLRLREDESLRVIAGDVVEVRAMGDDCLVHHR